ncbi:MAG: MATE family efflux transporter [Clostridia bacterium]|nr:MATE family efflux transporter [Clostridia bacterium]
MTQAKRAGRTMDMTVGSPLKLILVFMLPIMGGTLLQQFYSLVDTVIIGRVEGVTALAAVSTSGWLDWTVLGIALGITQGCSILISQHFGAKDERALKHTVGQSIVLSVLTALFLTALAQAIIPLVLRLMNSPDETLPLSTVYLRVLFAGFPMVMGYNLTASFLRALGDSRTPLIAMGIASGLNIALDLLFVAVFRMGVQGAALATVIAQSISFVYNLLALKKLKLVHPEKSDLKPDGKVLKNLFRLGFPMAMASAVISIGAMMLQTVINGFGIVFMAGASAAGRLTGITEVAGSALGTGMATYMGQNIGAGRLDRVKHGIRRGAQLGFGLGLFMTVLLLIFGRDLMRLFVEDDPALVEQVLDVACQYLYVMSVFMPSLYLLFVYRSSLQGLGETVIPMYSGFMELFMRIVMLLILPGLMGHWGVYFAEVSAWFGAMVLLMWGYYRHVRRLSEKENAKEEQTA